MEPTTKEHKRGLCYKAMAQAHLNISPMNEVDGCQQAIKWLAYHIGLLREEMEKLKATPTPKEE